MKKFLDVLQGILGLLGLPVVISWYICMAVIWISARHVALLADFMVGNRLTESVKDII